jgi:hypothetical protein
MILNPIKLLKIYLTKRYYRNISERHRPRILLLGHARHGKDTVADILEQYGFKCLASSTFALNKIMLPYFESQGIHYPTPEACFEDRVNNNNRAIWFREIENYNKPDWDRITKELLSDGYHVYVGMRSKTEFIHSRKHYDFVLWVDASARLPLESSSSNEMLFTDANIYIDNNGNLDDLKWNVRQVLNALIREYW